MATQTVQVIVVDFCTQTLIQSAALAAMTISTQDTVARVQSFISFQDSSSLAKSNPSFCGPKSYVASDPLISITPPASGLLDTDPWTISAQTADVAQLGVHTVTITASMVNYPSVPSVSVTFLLTVTNFHPCDLTVLQPSTI